MRDLAGVALEAVINELGAAEVLARVLAPVVDRDVKPSNMLLAPGPRRCPPRAPEPAADPDVRALQERLEAEHGSAGAAARAVGVDRSTWSKVRGGARPSANFVARLRAAVDAPAKARKPRAPRPPMRHAAQEPATDAPSERTPAA